MINIIINIFIFNFLIIMQILTRKIKLNFKIARVIK